MYHYYQIHYKMPNNLNTCVHVKKKIMLFVDFITHYLPCVKKEILEPLEIDGIYLFSKKTPKYTNKQYI